MVQDLIDNHADRIDNPHSVTKSQIGLGNVSNLAPADLPVSTATQSALDLKLDASEVGITVASLDVGGKVPSSQLPSTLMEYKGTWDASTNTPTLANGNPPNLPEDAGRVYVCSVGGTVNFGDGDITFQAGDWVILSASLQWQKSVNSNSVVSVNGYQGAVVLVKGDLGLGNVDNTSDTDKPISTATQAALNLKYDLSNPSGYVDAIGASDSAPVQSVAGMIGDVILTKSDVGLGSVDNVSAASLRNRSTHTGTQIAATISDFTASVQAVTLDAAKIGSGVVSNTEFAALDGIDTSRTVQTQLEQRDVAVLNYQIAGTTGHVHTAPLTSAEANDLMSGTVASVVKDSSLNAGHVHSTTFTWDATNYRFNAVTALAAGHVHETISQQPNNPTRKYTYILGAQATSTSTTYATVAGLTSVSLPVGLYSFKFDGLYQSAATTTGVGVRIANVTATVTTMFGKWFYSQAADGTAKNYQIDQLNNATNVVSTATLTVNTNAAVLGEGVFRVTSAGTVAIQLRTEINASQVLLQPDSVFIIEQIA